MVQSHNPSENIFQVCLSLNFYWSIGKQHLINANLVGAIMHSHQRSRNWPHSSQQENAFLLSEWIWGKKSKHILIYPRTAMILQRSASCLDHVSALKESEIHAKVAVRTIKKLEDIHRYRRPKKSSEQWNYFKMSTRDKMLLKNWWFFFRMNQKINDLRQETLFSSFK